MVYKALLLCFALAGLAFFCNGEAVISECPAEVQPLDPAANAVANEQTQDDKRGQNGKDRARLEEAWIWNIGEGKCLPYILTDNFKANTKGMGKFNEMKEFVEKYTCIKFCERTDQGDYIEVLGGDENCWSVVGRNGGKQPLGLGEGCESLGVYSHEFLHTMGFVHEHERPDRDDYVTIENDYIDENNKDQFATYSDNEVDKLGLPYDYGSVMHYGKMAFSKDRKHQTITTKTKEAQDKIGQRSGMSNCDIAKLNKLYKCPTTKTCA